MSFGNPDKGLCPSCGKGITQPADLCDCEDKTEKCTSPLCGKTPGECTFYCSGVECPRCDWFKKEE